MNKQYSLEEFDRRCEKVLADYPEAAHRAACASQNAEKSLIEVEGFTPEAAANDLSDLFIEYFAASLAGFAEE